ncbi:membrane-bound lytic murein transglycosylase F [Thiogranum longum]|uniref:Membrane-bound lytic murein transglycosylase F n=1 Tax=Thiogranum longum TaxID=1537524 RepID=A0A4R1HF81_9GAMM|nr:membrane-bound lytic murein transglycosylase MltF [Thiogranum longum]TCK18995.1 membrane-bound lytic murein transglycosylase F [Thiogranum longum]
MRLTLLLPLLLLSGCDLQKSHLDRVQDNDELVVLTRNSATTYYQGPFGPTGLEYDLAKGFAEFLGVKLRLVTPDTLSDILDDIQSGRGDVAAAGLTITEERKRILNFGPAYQHITPQLVYRSGHRAPGNIEDLAGTLEVVAQSSHAEKLRQLQKSYPELTFLENPELESEELLYLVWEQVIDYTVADSNEISINRRFYPELRVAFDISAPEPLAWAFPPGEDLSLLNKAREYFDKLNRSGRLEQLLDHYYGYVSNFDYVGTRRYMKHIKERLPPFRKWFEEAGKETGEDWRLLAAMGYQESHWNPKAVSPTGVRGIMMLTQKTMQHLGINKSRHNAQASIEGGALYLTNIKKKLPERIKDPDRTWLALAAYNVGFGHLEDARILAQEAGANPDKWADVKKFLPLLSQKKWYKKTRYGYARGREPVRYVENIRSYYDILVWLTDKDKLPTEVSPAFKIDTPAL